MSKPHKHAELIKAWADGIEIEYRFCHEHTGWTEWRKVQNDDRFLSDPWWEYRLKKEAKPNVRFQTNIRWHKGWQNVETSDCNEPNLRLLFDGETGELKSAEVL